MRNEGLGCSWGESGSSWRWPTDHQSLSAIRDTSRQPIPLSDPRYHPSLLSHPPLLSCSLPCFSFPSPPSWPHLTLNTQPHLSAPISWRRSPGRQAQLSTSTPAHLSHLLREAHSPFLIFSQKKKTISGPESNHSVSWRPLTDGEERLMEFLCWRKRRDVKDANGMSSGRKTGPTRREEWRTLVFCFAFYDLHPTQLYLGLCKLGLPRRIAYTVKKYFKLLFELADCKNENPYSFLNIHHKNTLAFCCFSIVSQHSMSNILRINLWILLKSS